MCLVPPPPIIKIEILKRLEKLQRNFNQILFLVVLIQAVIASAIEACIDTDAKDCEGTAPVRDSDSPVCNVVGYCDSASTSYGYTFANTLNECIQMCKDDPRCTWYSYNSDEECFQMPVNFYIKLSSTSKSLALEALAYRVECLLSK